MKQTITALRTESITFEVETLEPIGQLSLEALLATRQASLGGTQTLPVQAHRITPWKVTASKTDEPVAAAPYAKRRRR